MMNHMYENGSVLERESFHLPQAGLFADLDEGTGSTCLSDEFRQLAASVRIAIIADWQRGLETERRTAIVQLFQEVTAPLGSTGLPDKLAHFRSVCVKLGIECPQDLVILLQQI